MNDQIPVVATTENNVVTKQDIEQNFPQETIENNHSVQNVENEQDNLSDEEELALLKQKVEELEQKKIKKEQEETVLAEHFYFTEEKWYAEYEAVVGLKHRKPLPPNPCQDSAFASAPTEDAPFSVVITADGAGSSIVSDIGSQRIVAGIYRLIHTLYRSQFYPLDEENEISDETVKRWALILTKHAKGILEDLSKEYRRESNDFRCTLLVGVVGKYQAFWFKVGDGALVKEVAEKNANNELEYKLTPLGVVGKGEFANQTVFISSQLTPDDVQYGTFNATNLSGLFSMSDGAALKLVSNTGETAATRLSLLAKELRNKQLMRLHLTKLFYSEEFLNGHDGDDCSIALISR